jgi:hypothetical protein
MKLEDLPLEDRAAVAVAMQTLVELPVLRGKETQVVMAFHDLAAAVVVLARLVLAELLVRD